MRSLVLALLPVLAFGKDIPVADAAAFKDAIKNAVPGDALLLAEVLVEAGLILPSRGDITITGGDRSPRNPTQVTAKPTMAMLGFVFALLTMMNLAFLRHVRRAYRSAPARRGKGH